MSKALEHLQHKTSSVQLIIEGINAGIWDWDIQTGEEWWTPRFFEMLGYAVDELPASYATFLNYLLHPDDKELIESAVIEHLKNKTPFKHDIRLLTKSGQYKWIETSGMAEWDSDGIPLRMAGAIVDIHERKLIQNRVEYSEAMLNEAGRMARVGTWELDLFTQEIFWSDTLKEIHQLPYDSIITSSFAKSIIADEYKELVISSTTKSINDKVGYDIEFQCTRPDNNRYWIRTIGWPVMDAKGKIVKIRGIMQDIDQAKKRELALINLPKLSEQNNRLINFAHIVSHNLRSHSGNLSLLLETYHKQANEEERLDIITMLEKTAENLSETLEHLNEVVSIQSNTNQQKENCVFQQYLSKTCDLLETNLNTIDATFEIDFQAESIEYIPAYMDSLFLNMLTNAIKYRDPNRTLKLKISSGKEGKNTWITFQDNGQGIDMKRHNDKVFGMYKTFHRNKDARGIGLFITRNQIESAGGSIQCTSVIGEGTCFKVIWV